MRAKISGILFLVLFISVVKGCSTEVCGCVQFDTQVQFGFVDQNGNNLLSSDHPQGITEQDIDLSFIENGKEIPANEHFDIIRNESQKKAYMLFEPNLEAENNLTVAHLEFNETTVDTIRTKIVEEGELTKVSRVWYNGDLRWNENTDRESNPARYIRVIKYVE